MPPLAAPVDSISTLGGVDLGLVHAVFEPVMRTPIPLVDVDLRCTLVEDVDLEIPFFWICFSAADVDICDSGKECARYKIIQPDIRHTGFEHT